ncbi:MAG TPA: YfhO family protein [Thermoleophilaceae bacterium]|nr:YfhO family protein [Thermoleophilaceae bacterium]
MIYAVLSVVMVGPGLLPGKTLSASDYLWNNPPWQASRPASVVGIGSNFELADQPLVFQPFLRHTGDVLPHIPLWNPYISGGRPYLANNQSAVFSLFNLPAYFLPFWKSLAVIAALKLFVAALGAFALARWLGMRFGGALLTGLVFAFGTFFILLLGWNQPAIWAVLPWMLILVGVTARRPALLPGAGLAILVALSYFGGHAETTFHVLFVALAFFVFRLLLHWRTERLAPRALIRPAAAFALALIAGTAVAAVVILPLGELLLRSDEYGRRAGETSDYWPRKYLFGLFLHDYWGRSSQGSNIEPFMQLRGWYAGAVTLMLAPAALLIRPTATRIAVALFALFCVIMVIGIPPLFDLVERLPGFSSTHQQPMIVFFVLCLGLLAGWGLDELSARRDALPREGIVLAVAAVIFLVPLLWMVGAGKLTATGLRTALEVAWGFADPPVPTSGESPEADIVRMSALLQWLPLAFLGLVLIALRLRGRGSLRLTATVFVAATLALLAVDLFRANMGYNPAITKEEAVMPETDATRYLQSRTPNRFAGLGLTPFDPLPADQTMNFGLYDARGYDYPTEGRYDKLWRRSVNNRPTISQPTERANDTEASIRALNLLSVTDFMVSPGEPPLRRPGLSVAYRGTDAVIYRNARALPRVFVVSRQHTVDTEREALVAATAPGFDGRRVAVTERELPGLPQDDGGGGAAAGSARLVSYQPERVVARASASRAGLLVLTDLDYPGWKATVDGRDVAIERVNYLLRGVPLSAGTHEVEFRYEPASFRAGWIISLLSAIAVLAVGVVGLRNRRRPPGRPA